MPRLKNAAICIRHLDWSQSSQIVVLLTEQHGKQRGLAKGSKRMAPSSIARFSGGIELLTIGQVVASTRPTHDLATITEWDLLDDCLHLRQNLRKQRIALYAADAVNALLADHDPHPGVFAAMRLLMEQLRGDQSEPALGRFQWTLLSDCGYRPQLERDVHGGGPLTESEAYSFDPRAGGLTSRRPIGSWRVRSSTVQLLRGENWDAADVVAVQRANRLLASYVRALIDRELPTMRYVLGNTH
ncbi:MAG: DNA repair protein RecO [Phycisphaeraceae bacterium]|nr:DNA repair protein RecO [Phycisphaeraceae bacterium]